jgi:hypothetical protein
MREWRLAVLRVHLDLADRSPAVEASLVGYPEPGGSARTFWTRRYPLDAFGLDVAPPTALTVPVDLRDLVAATLYTDLLGESDLWLRLVPPYGYLGAVPWEASIVEATNVPVLRVPDRLPAASDLGRIWRAVIAVGASRRFSRTASYVRSLIGRLVETVQGEVEIDVFADAGTAAALRRVGLGGSGIRLHNPEDAKGLSRQRSMYASEAGEARIHGTPYGLPPTGRIWSDWIVAGLAGQAVRALHVVLDGAFEGDRPRLALSPDPNKPDAGSKYVFVTAGDVQRLADAIGAATLSFGSSWRNPSDLAIRMIADEIGQQRAGATIYSNIAQDSKGDALAWAYAFLAGHNWQRLVPHHPSLFLYAQPEYVRSAFPPRPVRRSIGLSGGDDTLPSLAIHPGYEVLSDLENTYAVAPAVPTWVAASDRYLGNQWAALAKSAASPVPTAEIKGAYDEGAAEALTELSQIVSRHARS